MVCESIAKNLGDFGDDEQTKPYVDSFKQWWDCGHEIVSIEERFWDDSLEITGKVDFIEKTPDGFAVVDLKTSYQPSKTWPIQGCAYAFLAKQAGYDIKKIQFIHLSKIGNAPKILEYPVNDDLFLSVLKTYNHFYKPKAKNVKSKLTSHKT